MNKVLDDILLSDNVVEEFHKNYENEEFKNWLLSVVPEVEDCKNLQQDNPWHLYNCLDHILHSVESMNKQTKGMDESTRKKLAYTMFLHDIGKPECYTRRYAKAYGREVDSFFNHNLASVKIAGRVLPAFGFNKKEQEELKLLIHEHDIFMFITVKEDGNKYHKVLTPELIRGLVKDYSRVGDGVEVLKKLIMVGGADSSAQNPELTAPSFELHDAMSNLVEELYGNKESGR